MGYDKTHEGTVTSPQRAVMDLKGPSRGLTLRSFRGLEGSSVCDPATFEWTRGEKEGILEGQGGWLTIWNSN